ncbi:hypothetical protein ABZ281_07030 [Streptomyces sp. NPDC006265]|uniref:hypothetical protein n=1 Tax=Streptomyces sp. NPDC006265 TaxID=3156740 RepID=UPI0033B4200D
MTWLSPAEKAHDPLGETAGVPGRLVLVDVLLRAAVTSVCQWSAARPPKRPRTDQTATDG